MRAARLTAAPLSPLTLVDRVYRRIWDGINTGRLQPGNWLRIQELARTLRVSETPIREALIRLQQSGIVETIPHVGTRVRRFTRRDIEEVFELREALECYALQQGASLLSEAVLWRLRRQLKRAEAALGAGSMALSVSADMELHTTLVGAAGNSRVSALLTNLLDQIRLFAGFGNRTPDGPRRFLEMHLRIVDLLLKRDIPAAIRLMSQHMQLAKQQALRGYFGSEPPPAVTGRNHAAPRSEAAGGRCRPGMGGVDNPRKTRASDRHVAADD